MIPKRNSEHVRDAVRVLLDPSRQVWRVAVFGICLGEFSYHRDAEVQASDIRTGLLALLDEVRPGELAAAIGGRR